MGQLKGNKRHGQGDMLFLTPHRNGDRADIGEYKGNWVRDKRDGCGIMKYANGAIFEGVWKTDKRYKGEFTEPSGIITKYIGKCLINLTV